MIAGAPSSNPLKGIACMLVSGLVITLNDAVMKMMTADYPIGEILFIRGFFVIIPIGLLAWRFGGMGQLRVGNIRAQAIRAALTVLSTFLYITSLRYLHLADALAITFTGPLFLTALAAPALGEQVGWRRWAAVGIGFAGVLVMTRPGSEAWQWAALLPLGAALSGASRDLLTRRMTITETSVSMLCVSSLAVTLSGLATLPLGWRLPNPADVGLLAGAAIFLGLGQFLLIEAYRLGEAVVVAPFKYTNLLWGVVIGFVMWSHLPDRWTTLGAILVMASGLYIFHRETVARR
ncbi:MAG: DMT family transporter [Rhodospirillales bacterium]|jgi:drug/metabolite transporter (DMT)-like permease|nr:DMT family transporter [Rhodospirillales bacterium]